MCMGAMQCGGLHLACVAQPIASQVIPTLLPLSCPRPSSPLLPSPQAMLEALRDVLDEDAEPFTLKLWQILVRRAGGAGLWAC